MNLNIEEWKYFFVGDLFIIQKGNTLSAEDKELFLGSIPCANGTAINNGIMCYLDQSITEKGFELFQAPALSLSRVGNSGITFLQTVDFFVADNAFCLKLKNPKSKLVYLFLSTILNLEIFKYSYGRTVTAEKYKAIQIKLPATADNLPDWDFMEQYIKSLHYKPITTSNKSSPLQSLDINSWKEFFLTSIFTKIEAGKAHDNMLDDGDDCIYLGAKKDDNCMMRHCASNPDLMHEGNSIVFICNGQGSVGYTNYINRSFIATTDLRIGYCDKLNKYNALFLVAVLDKERQKYSFGRKWGPHLKETKIKLPAKILEKNKYEPDWNYMENYMKSLPYGDRI